MPISKDVSPVLVDEQRLRQAIRTSLVDWAGLALAPLGHAPARHHRLLSAELESVGRGQVDRLMLLLPPGTAKSTYASVLFPVWWFTQHPATAVIAAAHAADLAAHFGRRARNLVAEHAPRLGYALARDARAAASWDTDRGGSYYAAGVRGPIVGRRADLVLIDDPVKSQRQADSFAVREQVWEWYRTDLIPRLKPGGRVVLIMTRWHPDDLGGRLLAEQASGGDNWRCLRLPALAEENDPLGRAPGAPLWPQWESASALARKRATIGERAWAAIYQQSPQSVEGLLFHVARIETIATPPILAQTTV
ncbi:MAG TPA: terminase family protein, partial [Candidatus Binataceae bacterium]|nr:terminase family protein [Candidatus Binataceae bacterium]